MPEVPPEVLVPRTTWTDAARYDETARRLAGLFRKNFEQYADVAGPEVTAAGPA